MIHSNTPIYQSLSNFIKRFIWLNFKTISKNQLFFFYYKNQLFDNGDDDLNTEEELLQELNEDFNSYKVIIIVEIYTEDLNVHTMYENIILSSCHF